MNTTIKTKQEELNNTTIENNHPSQEELMKVYASLSNDEVLERIDRNMLKLQVTMNEYNAYSLNFQIQMDRLNRTLDKFSN